MEQILSLIPEKLRLKKRQSFQAYDGVNNIFNLAYEILRWKVHRSSINAKLEPYLGFLHSVQESKPSLICDVEEIYRYLIDDFVIHYCQGHMRRDFTVKTQALSRKKIGKREYLNDSSTRELMKRLPSNKSGLHYFCFQICLAKSGILDYPYRLLLCRRRTLTPTSIWRILDTNAIIGFNKLEDEGS